MSEGEKNFEEMASSEQKAYADAREAMDELSSLMTEVDAVFAETPDRTKAEQIVLQTLDDKVDAAQKRWGEAIDRWLEIMRSNHELETEE